MRGKNYRNGLRLNPAKVLLCVASVLMPLVAAPSSRGCTCGFPESIKTVRDLMDWHATNSDVVFEGKVTRIESKSQPRTAVPKSAVSVSPGWATNVAIGSFIAGGALAVGTTGFLIWTRLRAPKASAGSAFVAPMITSSTQGVVVVGRW